MSYPENSLDQAQTANNELSVLQSKMAWRVILTFVVLTVGAIIVGAGKLLNLLFPAAALGVGLFLYFRAPILYNGFTWWIWLLTAFIRRMADFRSGFTEPSPLLLAPFLVTGVSLITVSKNLLNARQIKGLPFILAMLGTLYGYLVGLINLPSAFTVTREFLDWLPPIAFGFHLLANWQNFPSYYQNTQRV